MKDGELDAVVAVRRTLERAGWKVMSLTMVPSMTAVVMDAAAAGLPVGSQIRLDLDVLIG